MQQCSSTNSSTSMSSDDTNIVTCVQDYDYQSGLQPAAFVEIIDNACEVAMMKPKINGLTIPSFTMQQLCKVERTSSKEDTQTIVDMVVSSEFESETARVVSAAETLLSMATAVRSSVSVCSSSASSSNSAECLLDRFKKLNNNKRSCCNNKGSLEGGMKLDECWKKRKIVLSTAPGNDPQQESMMVGSRQMEEIQVDDDPDMIQFQQESHLFAYDSSGNRIHKCVICGRVFTVLAAFKSHVTTHMKQKNKCPICGKYFSRSWLLKGHMRIHTGERPYRCDFPGCHRAFADKSNLRSHSLIHTANGKNYVCPKCNRAFAQKRYLHKHRLEVCKI